MKTKTFEILTVMAILFGLAFVFGCKDETEAFADSNEIRIEILAFNEGVEIKDCTFVVIQEPNESLEHFDWDTAEEWIRSERNKPEPNEQLVKEK